MTFKIVPIEPTAAMLDRAYRKMRTDPSCAPFSKRILLKGWDGFLAESPEVGSRPRLATAAPRLLEALRPFVELADTGFAGSVYEGGDDSMAVLFNHATGKQITLGDFRNAVDALRLVESGEVV